MDHHPWNRKDSCARKARNSPGEPSGDCPALSGAIQVVVVV